MTTHVDDIRDLKRTNHGVEIELNRYKALTCKQGITESPLVPDSIMSKLKDKVKTMGAGDDLALNFSHLVLAVTPTVAEGTPGSAKFEIINPNMEGVYQVLPNQTMVWEPGCGKPVLMIFNMHHPLSADEEVFRVRVTNVGIPTKRSYARVHAYWGLHLSLKSEYYRNCPAQCVELEVGFRKSFLGDMTKVRTYANYVLETGQMVKERPMTGTSSLSIVPDKRKPPKAYWEKRGDSALEAGGPSGGLRALSMMDVPRFQPLTSSSGVGGSSGMTGRNDGSTSKTGKEKTPKSKGAVSSA